MAKQTSFLELTLPALNEFVDSWHEPLNQNFEDIDDFLEDLHASLVGSSSTAKWQSLRGDLDSLAARLDVSINPDGTLDVSGSEGVLDMATSSVHGGFADPRTRLDHGDEYVYEARQPFAGSRFVPVPAAGPSAASPPEGLDDGIAFRSADLGGNANAPLYSPSKPLTQGMVSGGATPLITALSEGRIRLSADAVPAVFNIDGYLFRLREILDLDYSGLAPADLDYIWIFVERADGSYNNANYLYNQDGGYAIKDLRKLQSGTGNGTTSGSTFTHAGTAKFNTAVLGKVKPGDILVIESGDAAGNYVIAALDGTTPDVKLTIEGTFKADRASVTWHVLDNAQPNVGAVIAAGGDPATPPAFVAGRAYIGRVRHRAGLAPDEVVTFTKAGVYDSGWLAVDAAADFPYTLNHYLGAHPTSVEILVRENATGEAFQPLVERQVLTSFDTANTTVEAADPKTATMLLPSMRWRASLTDLTLMLLNTSTTPADGPSLFTDEGGNEVAVGEIRVIARR